MAVKLQVVPDCQMATPMSLGMPLVYEEEIQPVCAGVRRFVYEHLINIDKTLVNIELAVATVSAE